MPGWFPLEPGRKAYRLLAKRYAKVIHFPYPKAGTTNSAVKVGYVSSTGGNTTWIAIPGDPRNNYLPRMEFIPESDELFIQQLNRPQNTNKVWIAKISDNSLNNIFTMARHE